MTTPKTSNDHEQSTERQEALEGMLDMSRRMDERIHAGFYEPDITREEEDKILASIGQTRPPLSSSCLEAELIYHEDLPSPEAIIKLINESDTFIESWQALLIGEYNGDRTVFKAVYRDKTGAFIPAPPDLIVLEKNRVNVAAPLYCQIDTVVFSTTDEHYGRETFSLDIDWLEATIPLEPGERVMCILGEGDINR